MFGNLNEIQNPAADALARSELTSEDSLAAELGLSMNTKAKRDAYVERVLGRWRQSQWLNSEFTEKAGMLPLRDEKEEVTMALLLENQLRFQRSREQRHYVQFDDANRPFVTLQQDTTTADEALPTVAIMPIIRRVYALVMQTTFSKIQPMAGPTSYVFFLDFIRENDLSNLLSVEYNVNLTPELGVPPKGKLRLNNTRITAVKQLMAVSWSTESEEDAKAILNMDVETELMGAFMKEFARDIFARHLLNIYTQSQSGVAIGQNLPGLYGVANPLTTIPARGALTYTDYKQAIFNSLIDADVLFTRANKTPSDSIIAGYGMAGFLQKMNTATGATAPGPGNLARLGISDYGTFAARWQIWGTEFLPDNFGFLYLSNPDPLEVAHVYAPYVPVMATPKIYADMDPVTGNYQNKDAWTRNIRERSTNVVVKPYGFMPILGPSPLGF